MSTVTDQDVQEIIATLLEVDVVKVGIDTSFYEDLEMDSLHKAEFIVLLERAAGAEISPTEAAAIDSVRDVMKMLHDQHRVP